MRFLSAAVVVAVLFAGLGVLWVEDTRGASEHKFMRLPDRTDNNPYSNPKIEDEVRIVMESMKTRLEMVGMSMDDLVMVEVHCPDLSLYSQFNDVYRTYFSDHFPARAFLGSGPLLLDGHFEVTGVAVRQ